MHLNNDESTDRSTIKPQDVYLPRNFYTKEPQGFAFIEFYSEDVRGVMGHVTYFSLFLFLSVHFVLYAHTTTHSTLTRTCTHNKTNQNQDAEYAKRKLDHEYLKGRELAVIFAKVRLDSRSPRLLACVLLFDSLAFNKCWCVTTWCAQRATTAVHSFRTTLPLLTHAATHHNNNRSNSASGLTTCAGRPGAAVAAGAGS